METLREHFKPHLGLPKARLSCFLMLVLAVIGQRTVSLVWRVLAVAFALSYQWRRKMEEKAGIKLKKHGHRAKSVFRQGLESLHRMFHLPLSLADRLDEFLNNIIRWPLTKNFVV
jgi:hypothetical protein